MGRCQASEVSWRSSYHGDLTETPGIAKSLPGRAGTAWELLTGRWLTAGRRQGRVPAAHVYVTADCRYVTIGCLEPEFYATLLEKLGLGDDLVRQQSASAGPSGGALRWTTS